MRGRSIFRRKRATSSALPKSKSVIFRYWAGSRDNFENWYPVDPANWRELIKRFGPLSPARDSCGEEVFMCEEEKNKSLIAYMEAYTDWCAVRSKAPVHTLTIERLFNNAEVL